MSRFAGGAVSAGAGSTTLPLMSLYAVAGTGPKLREVGISNTTNTALNLKLVRLTTAGTQGAGLTEAEYDPDGGPVQSTLFQTHTAAPTLGDDLGYRFAIGAAVGAGVIWTFGDSGIRVPVGTGNGIGVIVDSGTGQVCEIYFVWDE